MRYRYYAYLLIAFCLWSCPLLAQRNFFEVPSGEVADKGEWFFQTQGVISRHEVNIMAGASIGLGKQFEAGLTFNQWDFERPGGLVHDTEHPEQSPDILINAQKAFTITQNVVVGIGLRSGVNNVGRRDDLSFAEFNYITTRYTFGQHALVGGGYYANHAYKGDGKDFGFMAGTDIALAGDALHFVGDVLTGNSSLSIINAGLEVELPFNWSLSAGVQIPWPQSDNAYGATLQLSWN